MTAVAPAVLIDWDGDGNYNDAGDDVSARIRMAPPLSVAIGRDKARQMNPPAAAILSFTLDNQSGDYSMQNVASPLYGDVGPGRQVRAFAATGIDDFTRANSPTSLGSLDTGGAWTADAGTWGIYTNRAYTTPFVDKARATFDALVNDVTLMAVVNSESMAGGADASFPGILFRGLDANDYLVFTLANGGSGLSKVDGGVLSLLAAGSRALANSTDYAIVVECSGNVVTCYIDGTVELTYALTGGDTKYAGPTYTRAGLFLRINGTGMTGARWDNFRTFASLMAGRTDEPDERPFRGQKLVAMRALGGLAELHSTNVFTEMLTNITIDVAIGHVLDEAGWPAGKRRLAVAQTTLARWWVDNLPAFDAIRDLVLTEGAGALFYVDGQGAFVFEDRHFRLLTPRCTTSQVTLRDTTTEPIYAHYGFDPGLKSIVNSAAVSVRTYDVSPVAAIWLVTDTVTLGASETRPFSVSTAAAGFTGAYVSYTLVSGSVVSAILNRGSGKSATLTIVAGAGGAVLTDLIVYAEPVNFSEELVRNAIDASASIARYGQRALDNAYAPVWIPTVNEAVAFCDYIVSRYQTRVPQIDLTLNNLVAARVREMLGRRISDRVTIVQSDSGVNEDYTVESIRYDFQAGPNLRTTFRCEQADAQQYWVLGDAILSILGTSTRLGY